MKKQAFPDVHYPAINDHDIKWGLTITTIGYQSVIPHSRYPSKGHPSPYYFHPDTGRTLQEYQLIYITNGGGKFCTAHVTPIEITAGSVLLLFPDEWHTYLPEEESGWDAYWVGFKGPFANQLLQHHFFSKHTPVHHIGFNEQMVDLFKQMMAYAQQENTGFQQILAAITMHLLGLVFFTVKNNQFGDKDIVAKIEKARLMMREHLNGEVDLEHIARSLNISYSWFRRMFKRYTGLAPAQYQQQLKIQKAKEWLAYSDMTIKEIAFMLNFETPNYFNAFFKQKTGITPAVFRKQRQYKLP